MNESNCVDLEAKGHGDMCQMISTFSMKCESTNVINYTQGRRLQRPQKIWRVIKLNNFQEKHFYKKHFAPKVSGRREGMIKLSPISVIRG